MSPPGPGCRPASGASGLPLGWDRLSRTAPMAAFVIVGAGGNEAHAPALDLTAVVRCLRVRAMQVTIEIPDRLAKQVEPEREHLAEILELGLRQHRLEAPASPRIPGVSCSRAAAQRNHRVSAVRGRRRARPRTPSAQQTRPSHSRGRSRNGRYRRTGPCDHPGQGPGTVAPAGRMSTQWIPAALRTEVLQRAGGRCEYCRVHQDDAGVPHEPDHIVAEQHGGQTAAENLAFACYHCNRHKGTNLASVDPGERPAGFPFPPAPGQVVGPLPNRRCLDRPVDAHRSRDGCPVEIRHSGTLGKPAIAGTGRTIPSLSSREHPTSNELRCRFSLDVRRWVLDVGCSSQGLRTDVDHGPQAIHFSPQQTLREAVAVKRADRIGNAGQGFRRFLSRPWPRDWRTAKRESSRPGPSRARSGQNSPCRHVAADGQRLRSLRAWRGPCTPRLARASISRIEDLGLMRALEFGEAQVGRLGRFARAFVTQRDVRREHGAFGRQFAFQATRQQRPG